MWPTIYIPKRNVKTGIPPERFYLTTPTYPYELTEGLTSSGDIESITPGQSAEDEVKSSASFVSATLVERLRTYDNRLDELESTASFVSATLVERLRTYDNKFDELKSTGSFVSATIGNPRVEYDNWLLGVDKEDLKSSGSFVSGVLA